MAMEQTFVPKHNQPFTLEEAITLEIDTLSAEISRLRNSIDHLKATQISLDDCLTSDDAEDDDGELRRAYDENVAVIASQTERIELIKVALAAKLGSDSAKQHYGLDDDYGFEDTRPRDIAGDSLASAAHGNAQGETQERRIQAGSIEEAAEEGSSVAGGLHL